MELVMFSFFFIAACGLAVVIALFFIHYVTEDSSYRGSPVGFKPDPTPASPHQVARSRYNQMVPRLRGLGVKIEGATFKGEFPRLFLRVPVGKPMSALYIMTQGKREVCHDCEGRFVALAFCGGCCLIWMLPIEVAA